MVSRMSLRALDDLLERLSGHRLSRARRPSGPHFGAAFGASLAALHRLGREKGDSFVHVYLTGVNTFFVRDDLLAAKGRQRWILERAPNYYLGGQEHPPGRGRRMVDLGDHQLRGTSAES